MGPGVYTWALKLLNVKKGGILWELHALDSDKAFSYKWREIWGSIDYKDYKIKTIPLLKYFRYWVGFGDIPIFRLLYVNDAVLL